ncbi:MAG TPA: protein-export chaperone SecB [Caulobacteraceae bacterium]|jgi:preprotein translocase subunit SecB
MSDIPTDGAAPGGNGSEGPSQPGIRILAQYIKDLSFESPRAPESLRVGATPPQIDLNVELNANGREDGLYEAELKLTARASRDAETVFHLELAYAGLFQIMGVPASDIEPVLMIECPRYLFPFARRLIADLTAEGGFPPFRLEPIDFGGIYAARLAQQGQGAPTSLA